MMMIIYDFLSVCHYDNVYSPKIQADDKTKNTTDMYIENICTRRLTAVLCTIFEIQDVEKYRDLEI